MTILDRVWTLLVLLGSVGVVALAFTTTDVFSLY